MPGGVPLRWVGYATVTLLAVVVVSTRSVGVAVLAALVAAAAGAIAGGVPASAAAAITAIALVPVVGFLLAALDWPLRLLVIPGLLATLATQATPDGRPAHRYAASWFGLMLRARRRSLGRSVPPAGEPRLLAARLWCAPDSGSPQLRRARVRGEATVRFARAVVVRRRRWRGPLARPLGERGPRRRDVVVDSVELRSGERIEVRP